MFRMEQKDFTKKSRKKINFTIDSDIIEIIREEAEQDDRSLSQYINIILKEHIKEKAKWNYQVKLKKASLWRGSLSLSNNPKFQARFRVMSFVGTSEIFV